MTLHWCFITDNFILYENGDDNDSDLDLSSEKDNDNNICVQEHIQLLSTSSKPSYRSSKTSSRNGHSHK